VFSKHIQGDMDRYSLRRIIALDRDEVGPDFSDMKPTAVVRCACIVAADIRHWFIPGHCRMF
jgi:hypothetical protein